MPSLPLGILLADTYRVVRLIGTGGMGEVYEATHDRLAGRYAVKVLHAEFAARADLFQRFRREAEVTSALRHPNIVQVLDFNVTPDGHPYLVMEYLDGVELAAEIARSGPMPPSRILDIVGQIASALTAAHSHKIVHRDLKPQNLFLLRLSGEDREIVKVVDFGISKMREATTHLTRESAVIGTPQYMAPEQAEGRVSQIDHRADEFALAAITYELFSGRRAFDDESVPAILYQVVHQHPEPLSHVAPRVGPHVDAVIGKALAKSPDERYPSALAFHRELVHAVAADQTGVTAHIIEQPLPAPLPATAAERPATAGERQATALDSSTTLGMAAAAVESTTAHAGSSRRRWLLAGLAVTFLLAGAAVGIANWRRVQARQAAVRESASAPARALAPASVTRIEVAYSTEKQGWIEAATAEFAKVHPEIQVDLVGTGSFESAQEILLGRSQPTVWSPADSIQLAMLETDWRAKHGTAIFATTDEAARQPLVLTPLVFLAWEDRARVLTKAGGGRVTWKAIHAGVASARGWTAIDGDARWGSITLGHTDPTQSNSGLQALYLMLLERTGRSRLTVGDLRNRKNLDFVRGIERGVPSFGSSTQPLMTDMLRFGPSKYDVVVVYEATAISGLGQGEERWSKLKVCYPATTMWSDNPAMVLAAPWVTLAQQKAAGAYLAYLRSKPAQEKALLFGFRPADTSIAMAGEDAQNPFLRFAGNGLVVDMPALADMPDERVARDLMAMWTRLMRPGTSRR